MQKRIVFGFVICVVLCFAVRIHGKMAEDTKKVILIDPGHGGYDPGKVGEGGACEKDINLEIACELKKMLEDAGYMVYMTREKDCNLADSNVSNKKRSDLNNRIKMAEQYNADIFISIHQNSFQDRSVNGAQCFYYNGSEKGKLLASQIQEEFAKLLGNTRKAKGSGDYYVLKKSPCTSVIVECGFLSNNEEMKKLQNPEYQKKIATCILNAIKHNEDTLF